MSTSESQPTASSCRFDSTLSNCFYNIMHLTTCDHYHHHVAHTAARCPAAIVLPRLLQAMQESTVRRDETTLPLLGELMYGSHWSYSRCGIGSSSTDL